MMPLKAKKAMFTTYFSVFAQTFDRNIRFEPTQYDNRVDPNGFNRFGMLIATTLVTTKEKPCSTYYSF